MMTLEQLQQDIEAVRDSLACLSGGDPVDFVSIAAENVQIEDALSHSNATGFAWMPWLRYRTGFGILDRTFGKAACAEVVVANLDDIIDGIASVIDDRRVDHMNRVYEAKAFVAETRRREYIESLSGEVEFYEWLDYSAEDPFWYEVEKFVEDEWTPGELTGSAEISGGYEVSGDYEPTRDRVSITEERKDEIRARWAELGVVDDSEVTVEDPVYEDFVEEQTVFFDNADRATVERIVIGYLEGAILAEIFKDRDHGDVLAAIGSELASLDSYHRGTPETRGKLHSAALCEVARMAICRIVDNPRSYRLSGVDDPLIANLNGKFRGLVEFRFGTKMSLIVRTKIKIDDLEVATEANILFSEL